MSPLFRPLYLRLGFAMALLVALLSASRAGAQAGWEIVKIEDRDYVTVDSIKTFYHFAKMTRTGDSIKLENPRVEMELKVGSQECLMNSVKFVFSYPIETSGSKICVSRIDLAKLVDPVLRPNYIQNAGNFRTVIIDPGHGGKDAGATNPFGSEANYTLKVAGKFKTQLEAKGFKVLLTRKSDVFLSLQERVDLANAVKESALFISIHFNSGSSAAHGIETFTLSPQGVAHYGRGLKSSDFSNFNGNEHDSANIALATSVHGSILQRLGIQGKGNGVSFDRGIKRARWSVLTGVQHPAILVECGFVSHPYEARLIENEAYQNALASGLTDAVVKYRYAVSQRPQP